MTRRRALVGVLAVLVAAAAVVAGFALVRAGSEGPAVVPAVVAAPAVVLRSPADRSHPHGPELDEVTRRPSGTAWSRSRPLWKAAGRHPMWRGCQHRYNPALTEFLFSPSSA